MCCEHQPHLDNLILTLGKPLTLQDLVGKMASMIKTLRDIHVQLGGAEHILRPRRVCLLVVSPGSRARELEGEGEDAVKDERA